ncbi:hypothetical protein [Alteromonas sp. C1M14]|uniref:hypothetical protein n=1 Tax=Alteromonas sp. C1M14 TaxID=2841567 RepID=UPI001C0879C2|nr:hypothetical protein [Alteromonas sp. C1M14]MBU2978687.1 hypothetical protein [Alteromonas sp. C1M14]
MKYAISVAGLTLFLALSASAQAETVSDALQECSNEPNDLKRLMCFDALTESMNIYANADQSVAEAASERPKPMPVQAPQAPEVAATVSTPAPAPQTAVADDFGLEAKRQAEENLPKVLSAMVTEVTSSPRGDAIITLDNGMVWRENDKSSRLKVSKGDSITIERGVLGSFYLGRSGKNSRMAVYRIK